MTFEKTVPLGQLLRRPPRYGINAAAVPFSPDMPTYLRITDINNSGRFSPNPKVGVANSNASDYRLRPGELVFARTGASVGKSYLYNPPDGELVYAGFLINVSPDPALLCPHFLSFFVQTKNYWDWISRTSVRSGQPGVNGREFASLPVPMVDISIQKAIVSTLIDVDKLIGSLDRLIAKKQAIKQGMMQQLLTGRTRLNGFNQEWEWQPFTVVMTRLNTRKHQILASSYSAVGILPVVDQGKNLIVGYTNQIDAACEPGNDGVIIFGDHTCITKFVDFTFVVGADGTQLVKANDANSTRFMAYALEMDPVQSTGYNRHYKLLQEKILPVPARPEQDAITRLLMDADAEIEGLKARLSKAKAIKQGMMQELLTGRIRLPVMEPAS